jgi:hypothetical protein
LSVYFERCLTPAEARVIGERVLRSGTSFAANYRATILIVSNRTINRKNRQLAIEND